MIGSRIRTLRKLNKLSQEELGAKISVGKTTISNWETEYSRPDPESLLKLSKIFDCSVDYLLGKTDVRKIVTFDTKDIVAALSKNLEFSIQEYEQKIIDELKDYDTAVKVVADENDIPLDALMEQLALLKKIYKKKNLQK